MCGILGGWWAQAPNHLAQALDSGLEKLKHRGPNDQGAEHYSVLGTHVVLGQTRLSVIDLTSGGHQPMHLGNYLTVVFNGEIYNYKELREELRALGHIFRTDSDTEVLLTAWQQWGTTSLSRFVGMFAFAMLDRRKNTITLARDAFGIKPLYYRNTGDSLVFGSELSAIHDLSETAPSLDWQSAYDYLVHGHYDHTNRTFIKNINNLPPSHFIEFSLPSGATEGVMAWWHPRINERTPAISFQEATEELRARFLQNIRLHLRSDAPLGASLSGGIDSSAIVCAIRHICPDIELNTFSFISSSSSKSEERWLDLVNQHTNATSHKISPTASDLARDIDDVITAQGEPFGSTSIYAQYCVFRAAREQGMTVILEGQGADELLAGYNGYPGHRLVSLLERRQISSAFRHLRNQRNWPGRTALRAIQEATGVAIGDNLYQKMRKLSGRNPTPPWINLAVLQEHGVEFNYPRAKRLASATGRRVIEELAISLTQRGLGWLLRHGDRNSMRFSIESRVPFLTPDLVDFLLGLPEHYLISEAGQTKHIFRAAMSGIVPEAILQRKDKIGFETPELEWLHYLAPQIRKWLEPMGVHPALKSACLIEHFNQVIEGKRSFSWQIWRWINFVRWTQLHHIRM